MNSNCPKICILILNYNSWQATVDYIQLLQQQKGIYLSFLVVDNCSTDGSFLHLSSYFDNTPKTEVIQSDYNGGYAYGNNYGLKYLKNKIDKNTFVLISNNDIVVDNENLLKNLIEDYNVCKKIAFISPVMYNDNQPAPNCAWKIPGLKYDITTVIGFNRGKANKSIYYELPSAQSFLKVDCLSGSFFMGKLNTFIQLNYFDERTFLFEEERILAKKIKDAGLENYLALKYKFHHSGSLVINNEISNLKRLNYLLNSRVIFHKFYANSNALQIALLRFIYCTYLNTKKIQLFLTNTIKRK